MKISELLTEEMVIPDLKGQDKESILAEMTGQLASRYEQINAKELLDVLLEREKLGSTAIGENIAIPHGKLSSLKQVVGAFGRSQGGVDFESLDGGPTKLFFLLVAPEDSAGAHLKALARVSRLLKDRGLREKLLACKSRRDLYQAILEEDAKY